MESDLVKDVIKVMQRSAEKHTTNGYYDVIAIENEMLKMDQIEVPVTHIFAGGVYIRQIAVPPGMLIVGKRHRYKTCNVVLKGGVIVYAMDGATSEFVGPCIFESEANVKKLIYALEDTIFCNIHPTSLTDLDEIEKEFIISEEEYKASGGAL